MPATVRSSSCSPTSRGWYVRRRRAKCRRAGDDAEAASARTLTAMTTNTCRSRRGPDQALREAGRRRRSCPSSSRAVSSPASSARMAPARPPPWRCCSAWCGRPAAPAPCSASRSTGPSATLDKVGALVEGPALWPALTGAREPPRPRPARRQRRAAHPRGARSRRAHRSGRRPFRRVLPRHEAAARHRRSAPRRPDLLVLDEPANGLDPVGMSEMRELLGRLAARGPHRPRVLAHAQRARADQRLAADHRRRPARVLRRG